MRPSVLGVLRWLGAAGLVGGLLAGCGGSKKTQRMELSKQDLEVHQHVLVVGAGPALVKLEVGMAGKVLMKGLNQLVKKDRNSSFAESLQKAGLIPLDTAMETGVGVLQELGWKTTTSGLQLDSPGKKFKKVKLGEGVCEEAVSAGADSALILYERLVIDVGATEALARTELWAPCSRVPGTSFCGGVKTSGSSHSISSSSTQPSKLSPRRKKPWPIFWAPCASWWRNPAGT